MNDECELGRSTDGDHVTTGVNSKHFILLYAVYDVDPQPARMVHEKKTAYI